MIEYLDLIMFAVLMAAILLGFPVSFSIAGIGIIFAYIGLATGEMDITLLGAMGQRVFGLLTNNVLIAIPLFVLMGAVLEKSRIAEELLDTMGRLFGQLRGGLGHFCCVGRRASCGLYRNCRCDSCGYGDDRPANDAALWL